MYQIKWFKINYWCNIGKCKWPKLICHMHKHLWTSELTLCILRIHFVVYGGCANYNRGQGVIDIIICKMSPKFEICIKTLGVKIRGKICYSGANYISFSALQKLWPPNFRANATPGNMCKSSSKGGWPYSIWIRLMQGSVVSWTYPPQSSTPFTFTSKSLSQGSPSGCYFCITIQ